MRVSVYVTTLALVVIGTVFGAEGVRTVPDSAEALGKVGGRFATLKDPSVTRTNPASLVDLEGNHFQFNFQVWHGSTDFTQQGTGLKDSMISPWKHTGSLYLTKQLSDTVTAGFGVNAPFGLQINWPVDGLFQYSVPYETVLRTIALNPAIGIKLNEKLSVGVGLDIYMSELSLRQSYSWFNATGGPFPDGDMRFDGAGMGLGGYLALNYEPDDRQRWSVIGRLPVKVDYEGDFSITKIPAPVAGAFAATSEFKSEMEHPGSIAIGYGYDLSSRTTVGFDFEWIGNSSHTNLPLDIASNQPMLGGVTALPLNWKDALSAGVGMSHQVSDNFILRGGYLFSESPMNDRNYSPAVPANDRHIFSAGLGYQCKTGKIDLGYTYIHMEDRVIDHNTNASVNGAFRYGWSIMALSYTTQF